MAIDQAQLITVRNKIINAVPPKERDSAGIAADIAIETIINIDSIARSLERIATAIEEENKIEASRRRNGH